VVVDFSGDHRLPPDVYEQWYKRPGADNAGWLYGLTELVKDQLPEAKRISNPGCYPTAAVLALAPLLKEGFVEHDGIVVDALSGVSGAGAQEGLAYSFTELVEDAAAYRVGTHQHTPEMEMALEQATGHRVALTFTPHLVPMARGIVA